MIFFPVLQIRALLFDKKPCRCVLGAGPTVMKRLGFGIKNHSPTSQMKSFAPVKIFAVHEKTLVERAHLVQGLPSGHPKPAIEDIDVRGPVKMKVLHQKTAEEPGASE